MTKNTYKIISWNVNGLRAAVKKGFFNFIDSFNPDIFCIQETKAHKEQLTSDIKNHTNYQSYFSDSHKKGYSGVATYSKLNPKNVSTTIGDKNFDMEGRIMILEFDNFSVLNIYFPNGKKDLTRLKYKMDFYNHFLHFLENYIKIQPNIVICGDVNTAHKEIDLFHPKENSKVSGFLPLEREWIDKLTSMGFIDSFRLFNNQIHKYTWWDQKSRARERNVGWRIDYFFVSKNLKSNLKDAFILAEIYGSDHCPVGIILEF